MVKDSKKALVSKLRFPEFSGSVEWKAKRMDSLYSFMRNNSLSRDKLNYEAGTAKNIHYGDIHTKFSTLFDITKERVPFINVTEELPDADSGDYCVVGDLIFADSSEDTNDVGKCIEIIRLDNQHLLAGQHTILARQRNGEFVIGFGGRVFQSARVRSQIQHEAQGTKVYAISPTRLARIDIAYPSDKAEQQKIADCLSSLDELIAAQGRKVEALKTYKRGLMQQLFPREGETLPRLRFPEFRDAPEWDVLPLCKVAENLDNKRVPITESERTKGSVPYYGASGVVDYVKDYLFDEELLCVSEDGANLVARTYPIAFPISGKTWVNNHAHVLRFKDSAAQKIVEDYLNSIDLQDFITGMAQPKLNRAMLDTIPVPLPDADERKKIAEFLFSIDATLAGASRTFDALRAHKTGLMQQLFPSLDEA